MDKTKKKKAPILKDAEKPRGAYSYISHADETSLYYGLPSWEEISAGLSFAPSNKDKKQINN